MKTRLLLLSTSYFLLLSACNTLPLADSSQATTAIASQVGSAVTNAAAKSGIEKLAQKVDDFSANPYAHSVAAGLRTLEGTPVVTAAEIQQVVTAWGDPAQPGKWSALGHQLAGIVTRYSGATVNLALEAAAASLQQPNTGP